MSEMQRDPGTHIKVEFLVGGEPFLVMPVTVVEDTDHRIAHYLAARTPHLRRVLLDGSPVPRVVPIERLRQLGSRLVTDEWGALHQLIVTRPGLAHAVYLRWRAETWEFIGWYVNLQSALQRTEGGFTTEDHFLDILVRRDLTWRWKDEDELAEAIVVGRTTQADADVIRREGEQVIADIEARRWPFDGALNNWRPDPSWSMPGDAW